jgi:hypothetical protein
MDIGSLCGVVQQDDQSFAIAHDEVEENDAGRATYFY